MANDSSTSDEIRKSREQGGITEKLAWTVLAAGAAALAGIAARHALEATWKYARDKEPPKNPVARDVRWRDALTWAGVIGLAMGVARVLARRVTASAWKRLKGSWPPIK